MDEAERRDWTRLALVTAPAMVLIGTASGWLSGAGAGNPWFDALQKPFFMPPASLFELVWPILYLLLGLSLAMIVAEPPSPRRRNALILFAVQLVLNLAWFPILFAAHDIGLAKMVIFVMTVIAAAAAGQFMRLRRPAGLLLIPYLAWLIYAAMLNSAIEGLNPDAGASLLG